MLNFAICLPIVVLLWIDHIVCILLHCLVIDIPYTLWKHGWYWFHLPTLMLWQSWKWLINFFAWCFCTCLWREPFVVYCFAHPICYTKTYKYEMKFILYPSTFKKIIREYTNFRFYQTIPWLNVRNKQWQQREQTMSERGYSYMLPLEVRGENVHFSYFILIGWWTRAT